MAKTKKDAAKAAPAPEQTAEPKEKSAENLWMNRIPNDWFAKNPDGTRREIPGKDFGDGKAPRTFNQLNLVDDKGPYSVLIEANRVTPQKNKEGTPYPNMSAVRGYDGQMLSMSRPVKDAEGNFVKDEAGKGVYEHGKISFNEVKATYDARQKDFYAKQRAAAKEAMEEEGKETPEEQDQPQG